MFNNKRIAIAGGGDSAADWAVELSEIAEKISIGILGLFWQVLFKGFQELQSGAHLFQYGEMLIIRLIYLYEGH